MTIKKRLLGRTIIILTQNFNPAIINRYWLVSQKVIADNLILEDSIFAPQFTQVVTSFFNLIALPHQIQITTTLDADIAKYCLTILSKLDGIFFQAIGFNFDWALEEEGVTIEEFSKKYFFNKNSTIQNDFYSLNARFGSFMSKEFKNSRLQLDIKPGSLKNDPSKELMLFAFNCHIDLDNNRELLLSSLRDYNDYKLEAERIIGVL